MEKFIWFFHTADSVDLFGALWRPLLVGLVLYALDSL